MTKLSLCMIVKNEESSLPQCLNSVQALVDEMVVMDTGSSDRTIEIAKKFGAKVPDFAWCDDFSVARNEALKYVTGDWVLVLDADEVLNEKIFPKIREAISDENNLVVNLIRQEIGASQSPYSLVSRLFRNHNNLKFSRPYHAIIDDSVIELLKREKHWKIVDLAEVGLFHYGYKTEYISSLDKYNRARKAMEKFFTQHPNDPYVCSKLGGLYLQIGQEKKGIKILKQGLKSNQANPNVLYELHYHLGNGYNRQEKLEQAAKHYQKAIGQPILPQLKLGAYNNLGGLLQKVGDVNNAQKVYESAISISPSFAMGYYNLGMVLKAKGDFKKAITAYQEAIKINPEYAQAYQNLGVVLLKIGQYGDSVEAFKKAVEFYEAQNQQEEAEKLKQGLEEIGMIF